MTRTRSKHIETPVGFRSGPVVGPYQRRLQRRDPSPLPIVVETPPAWLIALGAELGLEPVMHLGDTFLRVNGFPVPVGRPSMTRAARIAARDARLSFIAKGTTTNPEPRSAPIAVPVVSVPVTEFAVAQVELPAVDAVEFDMGKAADHDADVPSFLDGPLIGLDKDDGSLLERKFMADKSVEQVQL